MTELEVCVWHGVGFDTDHVAEPSDSAIVEAIRRLDGDARNDLYLRASNGEWMGFGGGPDRAMLTFASGEEGPFFQAVTGPDLGGDQVQTRVGGQAVWIPPHMLLSTDDAIAAALEFAHSTVRPQSVAWVL